VFITRQDGASHFVRIDPKSHIFGPVDVREFDVVEDQSHGTFSCATFRAWRFVKENNVEWYLISCLLK